MVRVQRFRVPLFSDVVANELQGLWERAMQKPRRVFIERGGTLNSLIARLQQFTLLAPNEKDAIAELPWKKRIYSAGEPIGRPSSYGPLFGLLLQGLACRSKTMYLGFQQIVGLYVPGDLIGLFDLLHQGNICDVTALRPCEVSHVEYSALEDVLLRYPNLMRSLAAAASADALVTEAWLINMATNSPYQRMAHLLCEIFHRLHAVGGANEEDGFELLLSPTELGEILGLSQVHVSRTLQEMRRARFLSSDGYRLLVRNINSLEKVCDFDHAYLVRHTIRRN